MRCSSTRTYTCSATGALTTSAELCIIATFICNLWFKWSYAIKDGRAVGTRERQIKIIVVRNLGINTGALTLPRIIECKLQIFAKVTNLLSLWCCFKFIALTDTHGRRRWCATNLGSPQRASTVRSHIVRSTLICKNSRILNSVMTIAAKSKHRISRMIV